MHEAICGMTQLRLTFPSLSCCGKVREKLVALAMDQVGKRLASCQLSWIVSGTSTPEVYERLKDAYSEAEFRAKNMANVWECIALPWALWEKTLSTGYGCGMAGQLPQGACQIVDTPLRLEV